MEYIFTVTKDYVKSWTYIEAIRELLQNAYDFGNEDVVVDHETSNIIISNKDDVLDIKTLLLGYGTKSDNIDQVGGFGEGFLLALLVLVREGLNVSIWNGNDVWLPYLKYDETYDAELLCVKVDKNSTAGNDLQIFINGFDSYQLKEIEQTFLKLGSPYKSIKTSYGEILLDPCQKGKMYVEGLPITFDNNFSYGYNFNADCVRLDRDRKDINFYELRTITSNSLLYMEEFDFNIIDNLITKGEDDAKYIINESVDIPDKFKWGYSDYLKDKYKIKEHTVVTTKSDNAVISELEQLGEKVVTVDKTIQANIINQTDDYSANKLSEVASVIRSRSRKEEALVEYKRSSYKALKDWYREYCSDLSDEAKEGFDYILEDLEPVGFNLIADEIDKS